MENLADFKGKTIPINIEKETIFGLKAYKSVLDYPGKIDLAIIAIPAKFVSSALKECGKKRIKDVVVISAGFSEIGNVKEEKELINISKKYKIDLLGPNCFGIFNPYNGIDATFALKSPGKGNIAFISQSGALWSYISDYSIKKFGFSGFVSLGNMAGVNFTDFIDYFCKDKKTKSIVLYIEKLEEGKKFIEECKKCDKPVFIVKSGSSKEGSKAAVSHTGSLATAYDIYKGAFKQAGAVLCDSLIECFEKASKKRFPKKIKKIKFGKKVAIITNAGGAGALAADYLSEKKIKISPPKDLLGTALALDYKNALDKIKEDSAVVLLTPQKMSEINETAEKLIQSKKKVIALFLGGESVKEASELLKSRNIPCFNTLEEFRKSI
jgi:acyl-CoA synthetase (NDP forming)